ncbi:MAG: metallophosphoesterase [Candidatus Thorarchaeota archaeon]
MDSSEQLSKLILAGYQLTPEAYNYLVSLDNIEEIIEKILSSKIQTVILSLPDIKNILDQLEPKKKEKIIVTEESKKEEEIVEKKESKIKELETEEKKPPKTSPRKEKYVTDLEVISSPKISKSAGTINDFQQYFESRFLTISKMFLNRQYVENRVSISSLHPNKSKDDVSLVAMVLSRRKTSRGNYILELDDQNGKITAIISSSSKNFELIKKAKNILEDSVLCFSGDWKGYGSKSKLEIKDVYWPDIPYDHKTNKSYEDPFALFISDVHVGSRNFAENLFSKLIKFLNGKLESKKWNEAGERVKYLFVAGDVVDGVGIYPGQEEDLLQENIHLQYLLSAAFFEKIRSDVEIIIIPGNHDAARAAEPQTPIQEDFAPELYALDNVHLLGSPAYVKAHNVEVLMSHGNSILDINSAIVDISHETSIPAMIEMLRNRHLVPIYGKRTSIAPEPFDQLVISRIPDVFHTGHTHISGDENYRGVTLINSGTFQFQTDYQKSMNINPTTGKTCIVNLQTLDRTPMDFKLIS